MFEYFSDTKAKLDDKYIHAFVDKNKIEYSEFESGIYKVLHSFLGKGRFNENTKVTIDPKELAVGVKVEMEHTSSPIIAERIAKDHLAEQFKENRYYSWLSLMEGAMKKGIAPEDAKEKLGI